jgi:hypothetical protein
MDKTVKLWDARTGRELRTLSGHASSVMAVAYSPDGKTLLSGSDDKTVKLWDAGTGQELRTFSGHTSGVDSAAYSPDGRTVVSGSGGDGTVKLWDAETGRELRTLPEHFLGVPSVAYSPDGRTLLSVSFTKVTFWDVETGQKLHTRYSVGVYSVAYSPDGKTVVSGSVGGTVELWDAETGQQLRTLSGHSWPVRAVAYSPDGRTVLSGSDDNTVKLWDAETGQELRTLSGHTGDVKSVAYSPEGKTLLSGSWDGTVKLWDAATGKELAQFIGFRDGEWICITPEGYYNASPKGDQYLNIRIGTTVTGIDQYRQTFYKPAVVAARLGRGDLGIADPAAAIQNAPSFAPPVVIIRSPEAGSLLTAASTEISVSVADQHQPIQGIKVLVNGRLAGRDDMQGLISSRGLTVEAAGLSVTGNEKRVDFRFPLTLTPGLNRIEVLASNPYSEGRDTVEVTYQGAGNGGDLLPNLWILSIGINRYEDPSIPNLGYAVADAQEIIDVFKTQEGKLYRKVNSLLIADSAGVAPTRDNIIDNLDFLKQAGQRDVVMLFIAGHGVNDEGGNFLLLPSDAGFNADGSIRRSRVIPHEDIRSVLDVPGQKLVFIDACHSEGTSGKKTRAVENDGLVRDLMDPSTVIFTSSRGSELSQESAAYGHGVFTWAIIQGMQGEADLIKDGTITMKELDTYVSETVPRLTRGAQHPTTSTPEGYVNFTVAKTR